MLRRIIVSLGVIAFAAGVVCTAVFARGASPAKTDYYPEVSKIIDTEEWENMDYSERLSLCEISQDRLSSLSTEQLVRATVTYPFFVNAYCFDSDEMGYDNVYSLCDALKELAKRDDRVDALLSVYEETMKSDKNFDELRNIEFLLSQKDFTDAKTQEQISLENKILCSKYHESR